MPRGWHRTMRKSPTPTPRSHGWSTSFAWPVNSIERSSRSWPITVKASATTVSGRMACSSTTWPCASPGFCGRVRDCRACRTDSSGQSISRRRSSTWSALRAPMRSRARRWSRRSARRRSRLPLTSRQWTPTSHAIGLRWPASFAALTNWSTSRCRSCTTSPAIRASA